MYTGSNDVVCAVKLNTVSGKMIESWLNIRPHLLTGEGGCYVICNCNNANVDVVALYLSEQLNNNLCCALEKLIFQFLYTICCPPISESVRRKIGQMQSQEKRRQILW